MTRERVDLIRQRLTDALAPTRLDVIDESHLHAGHAGARDGRGHFRVRIVARAFEARSRIDRHRLVNDAVQPLFATDVHALSIQAFAPDDPGAQPVSNPHGDQQ